MTKKKSKFVVKVAGGATAQCLGLMSAIFVSHRFNRGFKIQYFPTSTGTYWPFQITFLLSEDEILDLNSTIRGLNHESNLEFGKVISNHPLAKRGLNYEKILVLVRKLNLEFPLQRVRGQISIAASNKNLLKVKNRTRCISGGYPPIVDRSLFAEMDARFKRSGKRSPFSVDPAATLQKYAVIHMRIGDKRSSFTNPADFGGDGIVDPSVFAEVLNNQKDLTKLQIFVVSDEPEVARKLLEKENIHAELNPDIGDIWDDLYFMSQAELFIGSWSQVSQLAAACVIHNGGRAFYPSTTHNSRRIPWTLEGLNFYNPRFLERDHPIYD